MCFHLENETARRKKRIFLLLKCELLEMKFFLVGIESRLKNSERKKKKTVREFVKMPREIIQTGMEGVKGRGTRVSADAADSPL